MRKLSKKSLCLAAAALTLTAGISAGTAMAYFTTYTEASGNVTLNMGFTETTPTEEFSNWTKHVTVKNTGDFACFVRVKALAGEKIIRMACSTVIPMESGHRERKAIIITVSRSLRERAVRFWILRSTARIQKTVLM